MIKAIGWDVGGAHLKAVFLDELGVVVRAMQLPCALWMGLDRLEKAVHDVLTGWDVDVDQPRHLVTMTGELVDLFANRHDGVVQISTLLVNLLGANTLFYCMDNQLAAQSFLTVDETLLHTQSVASANWHASASLVAVSTPNALLIDIGSTTTDIVVIEGGQVIDHGYTDAARMQQDALVYTGVVRTPVMAITQKLMLEGKETNVAAEYFATTADVYRLTEELTPSVDMADTADGEAKTLQASARRLARMVGHDAEDKSMACWQRLAADCRNRQLKQIQIAVMKHIKESMTIVGAGSGAFLSKAIAYRLDMPYIELNDLFANEDEHALAVCLPAYAVAKLALLKGVI